MPGILPMKVIKVGTSAQSRIAQACDRCRSKKIRCDGITPCCTQCSNVGFACKTSDKLSRRAFPRGYTESLEERVRALESEVKELKDLLDEKDEKIDILSKIHAGSRNTSGTSAPQVATAAQPESEELQSEQNAFRVQQSPCLFEAENSEPYFMGASSGRSFVDAFKTKLQESGKPCGDFKTEAFFATEKKESPPRGSQRRGTLYKTPPRLVSDQMINVYFQEWAPLFPILHKPTFLNMYADYMTNPESIKDQHLIAQLNLIFGIAALSAEGNKQSTSSFDGQWQSALGLVLSEQSLPTLQCLILAQLYCIASADYKNLLHYKGIAVSLSHRLGLHQSQKRFSLGALTAETRKKVFWTLYTLDCFSAALLGLPKLMKEGDICAEFPADVDDENVSERGFQSTLPGEFTRLSSALALFRASRIMSMVLDENYPAAASYELSLQKIAVLSNKLDIWQKGLPSHLRLQFVQDKPSTNVVGSRSPLLSLAYYYIRTLIHRPAVGSSLGAKAGSSMVALASSSKHIIQIVQLLEERRMSFSFCLNKNQLLMLAGFGLLYQGLELDRKRKLIQDSHRLMCSVIGILERKDAPGAVHFKKITCAKISVDRDSKSEKGSDDIGVTRHRSDGKLPAPKIVFKSPRKQLQAIASRFASVANRPPLKRESTGGNRSTVPDVTIYNPAMYARNDSQNSVSSVVSDPTHLIAYEKGAPTERYGTDAMNETPNLDYLSFSNEQTPRTDYSSIRRNPVKDLDPDRLTGFNTTQPITASFSGLLPSPDILSAYISPSPSANHDWASETWALPPHTDLASARSVLSYSEEEITSGEELSSCDPSCEFPGITMPNMETANGLDGPDAPDGDSTCDMLTPAFRILG